jgi:HEAT repeat protein
MRKCRLLILALVMLCMATPFLAANALDEALAGLKAVDTKTQAAACRALGDIGGAEARDALLSFIHTEYVGSIREDIGYGLAKIGGPEVEKALLVTLKDENSHVRDIATYALGAMKSKAAVKPLIALLKSSDWGAQVAAMEALAAIGDTSAVNEVIALMRTMAADHVSGFSMKAPIEALAELKDQRAVKPLVTLLRYEDRTTRDAALAALTHLGWEPATEEEFLAVALAAMDWSTLTAAGAKAVPHILQLAFDDGGLARAYSVLVPFGQSAVTPLIAVMKDYTPDSLQGELIAEVLSEIGAPAYSPLIVALQSKDWNTRAIAVMALGLLKDSRAASPIASYLAREDSVASGFIASKALDGLGEAGAEPLYTMLGGTNVDATFWAAFALCYGGKPDIARVTGLGCASKSSVVRGACAWILETNGGFDARKASEELLRVNPDAVAKEYERLLDKEWDNYWLLIAVMQRAGTVDMVNDFLNENVKYIGYAAHLWAELHGYNVMVR